MAIVLVGTSFQNTFRYVYYIHAQAISGSAGTVGLIVVPHAFTFLGNLTGKIRASE